MECALTESAVTQTGAPWCCANCLTQGSSHASPPWTLGWKEMIFKKLSKAWIASEEGKVLLSSALNQECTRFGSGSLRSTHLWPPPSSYSSLPSLPPSPEASPHSHRIFRNYYMGAYYSLIIWWGPSGYSRLTFIYSVSFLEGLPYHIQRVEREGLGQHAGSVCKGACL